MRIKKRLRAEQFFPSEDIPDVLFVYGKRSFTFLLWNNHHMVISHIPRVFPHRGAQEPFDAVPSDGVPVFFTDGKTDLEFPGFDIHKNKASGITPLAFFEDLFEIASFFQSVIQIPSSVRP